MKLPKGYIAQRAIGAGDLMAVRLLDYILFSGEGMQLGPSDTHAKSAMWWLIIEFNTRMPVAYCGMSLTDSADFIRAGVMEEHRGKGIQKAMIALRLATAKRYGHTTVKTYVNADNAHSVRALMSCGFKAVKASHNKHQGLWLYVQASTAHKPRKAAKKRAA